MINTCVRTAGQCIDGEEEWRGVEEWGRERKGVEDGERRGGVGREGKG